MIQVTQAGGGANLARQLTPDVVRALQLINERQSRATSLLVHERYDRCRDELLRNPDRSGDPQRLVSCAWGNAGKVLRFHSGFHTTFDPSRHDCPDCRHDTAGRVVSHESRELVAQFVRSHPQLASYRQILELLLQGAEAEDVALVTGWPLQKARVQISRARAKARAAWEASWEGQC